MGTKFLKGINTTSRLSKCVGKRKEKVVWLHLSRLVLHHYKIKVLRVSMMLIGPTTLFDYQIECYFNCKFARVSTINVDLASPYDLSLNSMNDGIKLNRSLSHIFGMNVDILGTSRQLIQSWHQVNSIVLF